MAEKNGELLHCKNPSLFLAKWQYFYVCLKINRLVNYRVVSVEKPDPELVY